MTGRYFEDLTPGVEFEQRAGRDGFAGMMAIRPSQVAPINAALTPFEAEIDWAQRVVARRVLARRRGDR